MRDRIEAAIKDAYYAARDSGGTMHTAASDATDAVLAVLAAPDEATLMELDRRVDSYARVLDDPEQVRACTEDVLAALAGTSAQARHTDGDATGGGEHG